MLDNFKQARRILTFVLENVSNDSNLALTIEGGQYIRDIREALVELDTADYWLLASEIIQ